VVTEEKVMGNPSALAGFLLLLGVASASPTGAQTPGLVNGAYERMSAGNQKIARALFDAQAAAVAPAPPGSSASSKALTLDEIAAQKQNGTAWGQVFSAMKARGLLLEKNLGQVVSRYEHQAAGAVSAVAAPRAK
jgi:hypothetical protein